MTIKYTRNEIERHWLADPEKLPPLGTLDFWQIEDLYLPGTRLRLRRIVERDGSVTYKLGKKYGPTAKYTEPIVSIYLEETEYNLLNQLGGVRLQQIRYRVPYAGMIFNVNIYPGLEDILVEAEYTTLEQAMNSPVPDFCDRDISGEGEYEGWSLAQRQTNSGEHHT